MGPLFANKIKTNIKDESAAETIKGVDLEKFSIRKTAISGPRTIAAICRLLTDVLILPNIFWGQLFWRLTEQPITSNSYPKPFIIHKGASVKTFSKLGIINMINEMLKIEIEKSSIPCTHNWT